MVVCAGYSGEEDCSGSMSMISSPMDNGHRNGKYQFISGEFSDCRLKSMVSIPSPSSAASGVNYIEHRVSKMDTLAGVAIRYGVEVSDIKRLNGLVTDLQMFAHKSLQIPLPGRHPPSPILSNGSATQENGSSLRTPPRYPRRDLYKDFQSLNPPQRNISAAMNSLQGYYGLAPPIRNGSSGEGTELAVYKISSSRLSADEPVPWATEGDDSYIGKHRNSRRMANGFHAENGESAGDVPIAEVCHIDSERSAEKSVRRRQKSDADLASQTPELILKDENSGGLLGRSGKGLALRPKSASKSNLTDMDAANNGHADPAGNSTLPNYAGVRRSSSTSCMQESLDNAGISWPASKWTLKPDLQVLSAVAIPIFDGLPISGKRNKAALD